MARKQATILDLYDTSNYWFVIQWISRRFDEEERDPFSKFVMSKPLGDAIDASIATDEVIANVRASWRTLQRLWIVGWEKESSNKISSFNAEEYFEHLVTQTNQWLDDNFPANDRGAGQERKRLLTAVRQQRLREKRKGLSGGGVIQVSITGALFKSLYRQWDVPEQKRHEVVRSALSIVLDSPDLLARAKMMAGINKNEIHDRTNE